MERAKGKGGGKVGGGKVKGERDNGNRGMRK